jgi:hypothetical protein
MLMVQFHAVLPCLDRMRATATSGAEPKPGYLAYDPAWVRTDTTKSGTRRESLKI